MDASFIQLILSQTGMGGIAALAMWLMNKSHQDALRREIANNELMRAEHFAAQYELFPQGQFVALIDDQVVGQGSGFFIDFDFDHPDHSFNEICESSISVLFK